jgi:hypothetical protein
MSKGEYVARVGKVLVKERHTTGTGTVNRIILFI